ncbi:hypothetical protein BV20DRAFT_1087041, partial [Pilatotrama ljubarskyi]
AEVQLLPQLDLDPHRPLLQEHHRLSEAPATACGHILMSKQKYYAVHNGRQGTKIYTTWEETKANVSRFSGAIHKSFRSLPEARAWLLGVADAAAADAAPLYGYPGAPPPPESEPATQQEPPTQAGASQIPVSASGPPVKYEEMDDEWPDEEFFQEQSTMDIDGPTAVASQLPFPGEVEMKEVDDSMQIEALEATAVAAAPPPPPPEIKLSPDQQRVLDMVKQGKSVFFTGSAGAFRLRKACMGRAVHRRPQERASLCS